MTKTIRETLKSIGITDSQSDVYLAILKHPAASVLELARATGKNRQQIYNDAEKLMELGLLEKTNKQKRKYIANNPQKILEIAQDQKEKADEVVRKISQLIPEMEHVAKSYKTQIFTKFYEGDLQIAQAFEKECSESMGQTVLTICGEVDEAFKTFPEEYWKKWYKKFVKKKGSAVKMIVTDTPLGRQSSKLHDVAYKRECRFLKDFPVKINIEIFGDHVLLVSFKDKIAVWIESAVVAASYRVLFETLWKQASK